MTDWDTAACIGKPLSWFFPNVSRSRPAGPATYERAKKVCDTCPIETACLEWQMRHEGSLEAPSRYGVYGGLSPDERARLYRQRGKAPAPPTAAPVRPRRDQRAMRDCDRCGRYLRHHGRGLCDACWKAVHARGGLDQYERTTRPFAQTVAEWEWLRSEGYTKPQAAERLGISVDAIEKAVKRAQGAA